MKLVLRASLCILFLLACRVCFGQESIEAITDMDKYETEINAILKTRLQEEKDYVSKIVELVKKGDIPRELVDKSVLWVRAKRPYTNRGFVYFEQVLFRLGEKVKIEIPRFDYSVYQMSIPGRR